MIKLAKWAMGATILALLIPQLPLKAHIDLPLFYLASITALVLGGAAAFFGVKERCLLRERRVLSRRYGRQGGSISCTEEICEEYRS